MAREVPDLPVTVSAVGPVLLSSDRATEVAAAVGQALANAARHAEATSTAVYAAEEDGMVVVSIRDDGRGFRFDEQRLRAEGKAGILRSMKGRVEDLGGTMRLESGPGRGTEVEFRIPKEAS